MSRTPTRDIDLLHGLVALALLVGAGALVILPLHARRVEQHDAAREWRNVVAARQTAAGALRDTHDEVTRLASLLRTRLGPTATTTDWSGLVAITAATAENAGLALGGIQRGTPRERDGFAHLPLEIGGSATLHGLVRFLTDLRNRGVDYRVEALTCSAPATADSEACRVNLRIELRTLAPDALPVPTETTQ